MKPIRCENCGSKLNDPDPLQSCPDCGEDWTKTFEENETDDEEYNERMLETP